MRELSTQLKAKDTLSLFPCFKIVPCLLLSFDLPDVFKNAKIVKDIDKFAYICKYGLIKLCIFDKRCKIVFTFLTRFCVSL